MMSVYPELVDVCASNKFTTIVQNCLVFFIFKKKPVTDFVQELKLSCPAFHSVALK